MKFDEAKSKIQAYHKEKLPPGGFLSAILSNDLASAVLKADSESQRHVVEITKYCWDNLPSNIWGSIDKVDAHLTSPKKKKETSMPTGIDIKLD
jgi:hypothetical protein